MAGLLRNRWIQLVAAVVATAALALAVAPVISPRTPTEPTLGPVKLTTGSTLSRGRYGYNISGNIVEEELPLTAAEAVAAGWKDPVLCTPGRGKYFQKASGEGLPYLLTYNNEDHLIGIYHISTTEMPPPWERTEQLMGSGVPVIDYEHWGLFVFFRDPTRACDTTQSGARELY